MKTKTLFNTLIVLAVIVMAVPSTLVMAANPPHPTYVDEDANPPIYTPTVDGDTGDWDLSLDYFSDMILAGGNGGQTEVLSKLYLRYNCDSGVLYALVLTEPGVTIDADGPLDEHYIKLTQGSKVVDGNASPPDGVQPDFAFVGLSGGTALGWEASFFAPQDSYPNFNVHTNVNYSGSVNTSQVPGTAIDLVIDCNVPSAVSLSFFGARATSDKVVVKWETASEIDNVGFNLYRSDSLDAAPVKLNAGLIASQAPGSTSGAVYRFFDEDVQIGRTYYYWLEDVDIYGVSTRHGPVSVVFGLVSSSGGTLQPRRLPSR
ncbi:MAG: hypothetical protein PVJ34_01835 [Anaerolineae bacterium]|jgi:hypothetical protein